MTLPHKNQWSQRYLEGLAADCKIKVAVCVFCEYLLEYTGLSKKEKNFLYCNSLTQATNWTTGPSLVNISS